MKDEHYYYCPLMQRKIDVGACYDINAVVEKCAIKEILNVIEKQFEMKIDLSQAKEICPGCRHYPFSN